MKRTLSFILALVLLIGLVPMQAFATETTDKTETTELSHKHEYVNGVCEKCVYSYPMDSVEKLEGTIAIYNNTYLIAKGYYGAVIALVNLDFNAVSITRNPDANLMGYAFLKELPTTGQVPSYAGGYTEVIWDEAAEAELKIPDDAAYLYIYYNSNDIVYLPASVVFKNVEQTENQEDEKVEEKEENVVGGATIKVATWNIGHFSGGGISSKVTDAQFDKAVGAFKEYIYEDLDADLLAVNEYSAMFTSTKRAEDSLFTDFASTHFEGQQYNYSCNAMFSNWPVQNLQAYTFECNQNAVIGHTSAIKASDYYYLRGEILLDGTVVTVVAAHLGFDLTKTPDTVCVNQITELLESLADCERVILLGDWNVLDFAYFNRFVDAGYTLGNADSTKHTYAYSHPNRSLDNIIVKGLEIADFQIHETTLSDHYAVTATIRLSSEDEIHNHSYESVVTAPTCTEGGYTTHTCAGCGATYTSDHTAALGHSYANGSCTRCGEAVKKLSLRYDDRYDVTGEAVEILDAGKPTSYQVGYGVAENSVKDTAVVTLSGGKLIATGIGTAQVMIDGEFYEVTVTAAPISLILLAGQSNMQGSEGDANQSIVCPDGMVYATYGDRYTMTTSNATNFAASALTGAGSALNVNGTTTNLQDWPIYLLNEAGAGKAGPDSGFAFEWVQQTGEKIWVVNAAHGGSSINTWQKSGDNYKEALLLFKACQETLQKEIAAGHYTLSHMGYFWCQGCTDYSQTAEWYVEKYLAMHENFKTEMAFDHDSDPTTADKVFEFAGIIPVRAGNESYTSYRQGIYADKTSKNYYESFKDLRFTGPRVAQYWMTNNPNLPDIWNVCNIGEDWVWMPDGTNGVSAYFQAHYENGTVDYTTQVQQKASWYTPTTPADVHDSIHYNQIGYNEVGREAVRNALIMLGEIEAPDVEITVEFLSWDGYTSVDRVTAVSVGSSSTLVVPKVYPVWKSKEVTYQLSEGLCWNYYDLLADNTQISGNLTAIGAEGTVSVVESKPNSHFIDHLAELPEKVCCGLNLWDLLEHDEYYYANGSYWTIYSSATVKSITIYVNPGDMIYASSFGAAGSNGHSSTNGIRVTFFSEYGTAKTCTAAETYAEFTVNGGYLVVPEGTVAMNIPLWGDSDEWEVYILNREHDTTCEICSICGKSSHTHSFSAWETVTEPSPDGPGIQQRTCACGETERREVEGVWQNCDLGAHLSELPEHYCAGTNLWTVLEHDKEFYSPNSGWHVHSSGTVFSVTIHVNPGDRVYATSFGDAGANGGSANGIRVVWFSADGMVKSTDPAATYAEFVANGGYLIAPEGAIAINIPMWNNSDDNEIYILNAGHNYTATVTAPTCTEGGYTTHTCACGHSFVDSYVDALGHTAGPEATCTTAQTCTVCNAELVAARGHSYTSVVTAPTCTEKGYTTHTCACGHSFVDSYVDAAGHSFGDWYVSLPSTATTNGQARRDCTCCDHFETRLLPLLGDVNGDGSVNTRDSRLIMQYELGLIDATMLDLSTADVNGDGKFTTADAKLIMQLELGLILEFPK